MVSSHSFTHSCSLVMNTKFSMLVMLKLAKAVYVNLFKPGGYL